MSVVILPEAFNPWQLLEDYQQKISELNGKYGATAVFVGTMRDFNEGDNVSQMFLEYYPGMTEKHLEKICTQATADYGLLESLVVHRVGEINPKRPHCTGRCLDCPPQTGLRSLPRNHGRPEIQSPILEKRTTKHWKKPLGRKKHQGLLSSF